MIDPDKPDPPPRTYGFKPKEFERLNAPSSAAAPAPTAQDLARLSGPVRAPSPAPAPTATPKPGDPNDVLTLLQQNRRVEHHHGGDQVQVRPIRSRRRRDYWLLLLVGNFIFVALPVVLGLNAVTVISAFAGLVLFNLALTWIMWIVMSDY